jgi:two-component system KDP operon response regulator KdpE
MTALTILVIDDNAIARKAIRLALEGEGYSVLEAPDGRTALELPERHSPDLVLQDLFLPDMDGFELLARLRRLPQKPVDNEHLLAAIRKALGG